MTEPKAVTLSSPAQVAVLCSLDRIQAVLNVEASQLAHTWNQNGTADALQRMRSEVQKMAEQFIRDAQRVIEIAREMPKVVGP